MPSGGKAQIQKDRFVFPTDLGAILIYLFREKLVIPTDQTTLLRLCLRLLVKLFVKYTEPTQCVRYCLYGGYQLDSHALTSPPETWNGRRCFETCFVSSSGSVGKILATQA